MTTLVVFPLQEELDVFLGHCQKKGLAFKPAQIGRLPVFQLPDLGTTLARGGTGKAQFALQTQHLIDIGPAWSMVVCAGAAGALVDDVTIGDVVVATVTVEHDYRNRFNERPLPSFEGEWRALEQLRGLRKDGVPWSIHFGPVASGDEDIMAADRRSQLHKETGGLVAAWEGAGGARACAFSGVPYLEVRGVTDGADGGAATAFEINLEKAMDHIGELITTWLAKA